MKKVCAVLLTVVLLCGAAASMADGLWTCPECGKKSGANFCPWCGAKKPRDKVVCGDCGAEYPADAGYSFCANCEARLPGGEAPAAKEYATGDIVTLGRYEQDNDPSNGPEPIEWIVLDVQDGMALLLSRYCLEVMPYYPQAGDVTWATSALREWMNGESFDKAFDAAERRTVLKTRVDNSDAQGYGEYYDVTGGSDTDDYVFALSYHEAFDVYFTDNDFRMAAATDYAIACGAWTWDDHMVEGKHSTVWWLRSPGCLQEDAMSVFSDGDSDDTGVYNDDNCARPAMWITAR